MESKTRLKQRLSRLFRPSAILRTACNSTTSGSIFSSSSAVNTSSRRNLSPATDNIVAHDPVFIPHDTLFNSTRLLDRSLSLSSSSRLRSLDCSGGCRPTKAASDVITTTTTTTKAIDSKKMERRVRETGELYETGEREGRTCPPASPSSPSKDYSCNLDKIVEQEAEKKKKDKAKINNNKKKLSSNPYGFTSSSDDDNGAEFFSSDNEDETEAFFSSRSFSSDSSEFYKRPSSRKKNKNKKDKKQSSTTTRSSPSLSRRRLPRRRMNSRPVEEERSGIPVMKRSSDPYVDFRNSMVEMIVDRQIFGARDLERLLQSYLSLNSPPHHSVILRAFTDISQVLFGH